ncbi:MAG: hypothetical protein WD154_02120 [Nitrosopumilaceae archaeon]
MTDLFFDLILSEHIQFIALREEMVRNAYDLAVKAKMPVYDVTFVVLATELGVELKTFDKQQYAIFKKFTSY